ncbi:MAG: thioredoxin domain-containing protein [Chlamydiales bacterium]|nr:thioredoxin domain-containing protein [Chlamydiales bacterium]
MSPKILVLSTLGLFLLIAGGDYLLHNKSSSFSGRVATQGCPLLGSDQAPVQMVVFEDLRCTSCRSFHLEILPKIKEKFIDTGKVQCALLLLSFLDHSEPLALQALSLYEKRPDSFFSFVNQLYTDLPPPDAENIAIADAEHIKKQLQENLKIADKLMNGEIATPAVFINGKATISYSVGSIASAIEKEIDR